MRAVLLAAACAAAVALPVQAEAVAVSAERLVDTATGKVADKPLADVAVPEHPVFVMKGGQTVKAP